MLEGKNRVQRDRNCESRAPNTGSFIKLTKYTAMHYIIALIITLIVLLSPSPGIAADATGFTVQNIHNLDRATENPWASLIPAPDGNLYGTSNGGGTKPLKPPKTPGAVYKTNPSACSIDPSSPDCFKVVHTFSQPDAQGRNSDGYGPRAPLSLGPDGFLYGTTFWGGQGGNGVLFRIDPATATFTTLFSFGTPDGPPSGANPMGGPVSDGHGNFYGAAKNYGAGVIYKWSGSRPAATVYAFRVTHDAIRYPDGAAPYGSPVFGADGKLYGMTFFGGKNNAGTVYSLDPVSKALKVIYDFAGYTPSDCPEDVAGVQSLFLASDGKLYGTSLFGGSNGTGFAFRVDPAAMVYGSSMNSARARGARGTRTRTARTRSRLSPRAMTGCSTGPLTEAAHQDTARSSVSPKTGAASSRCAASGQKPGYGPQRVSSDYKMDR